MINLYFCNVVGTKNTWEEALKAYGKNPNDFACLSWHWATDEVRRNAIACFKVRPGDPTNYIVPKELA